MHDEGKRRLYRRFAALLDYPEPGLIDQARYWAGSDVDTGSTEVLEGLRAGIEFVTSTPLYVLQETYTVTFDLDPVCCPYVGYHLFGESYKRGAMMAKLKEAYRELSLEVGSELPDHLSYVLRFLAALEDEELAGEAVSELLVPALERMLKVFGETANAYTKMLQSLLALLGADPALATGGCVNG